MSEQLSQIQREIATQGELIATTESALKLAQHDLAANEKLKADGFISDARLSELQRVVADYRAACRPVRANWHRRAKRKRTSVSSSRPRRPNSREPRRTS